MFDHTASLGDEEISVSSATELLPTYLNDLFQSPTRGLQQAFTLILNLLTSQEKEHAKLKHAHDALLEEHKSLRDVIVTELEDAKQKLNVSMEEQFGKMKEQHDLMIQNLVREKDKYITMSNDISTVQSALDSDVINIKQDIKNLYQELHNLDEKIVNNDQKQQNNVKKVISSDVSSVSEIHMQSVNEFVERLKQIEEEKDEIKFELQRMKETMVNNDMTSDVAISNSFLDMLNDIRRRMSKVEHFLEEFGVIDNDFELIRDKNNSMNSFNSFPSCDDSSSSNSTEASRSRNESLVDSIEENLLVNVNESATNISSSGEIRYKNGNIVESRKLSQTSENTNSDRNANTVDSISSSQSGEDDDDGKLCIDDNVTADMNSMNDEKNIMNVKSDRKMQSSPNSSRSANSVNMNPDGVGQHESLSPSPTPCIDDNVTADLNSMNDEKKTMNVTPDGKMQSSPNSSRLTNNVNMNPDGVGQHESLSPSSTLNELEGINSDDIEKNVPTTSSPKSSSTVIIGPIDDDTALSNRTAILNGITDEEKMLNMKPKDMMQPSSVSSASKSFMNTKPEVLEHTESSVSESIVNMNAFDSGRDESLSTSSKSKNPDGLRQNESPDSSSASKNIVNTTIDDIREHESSPSSLTSSNIVNTKSDTSPPESKKGSFMKPDIHNDPSELPLDKHRIHPSKNIINKSSETDISQNKGMTSETTRANVIPRTEKDQMDTTVSNNTATYKSSEKMISTNAKASPDNAMRRASFRKKAGLLNHLLDQENRFIRDMKQLSDRISSFEDRLQEILDHQSFDIVNGSLSDSNMNESDERHIEPSVNGQEIQELKIYLQKLAISVERKVSKVDLTKKLQVLSIPDGSREGIYTVQEQYDDNDQCILAQFREYLYKELDYLSVNKADKVEHTLGDTHGVEQIHEDTNQVKQLVPMDELREEINEWKESVQSQLERWVAQQQHNEGFSDKDLEEKIKLAADAVESNLQDVISSRLNQFKEFESEIEKLTSQLAEKPNQEQIISMLHNIEDLVSKHIGRDRVVTSMVDGMKSELKQKMTRDEVLSLVKQLLNGAKEDIKKNSTLMVGHRPYRCLGCNEYFSNGVNNTIAPKVNHDALPSSGFFSPAVVPLVRSDRMNTPGQFHSFNVRQTLSPLRGPYPLRPRPKTAADNLRQARHRFSSFDYKRNKPKW